MVSTVSSLQQGLPCHASALGYLTNPSVYLPPSPLSWSSGPTPVSPQPVATSYSSQDIFVHT